MNALFSELQLGALKLRNRIGIPAMCQYSAQNGLANDWHFVHYASRAVGGAGLMIVEATAVCPEGRISAADLGLWHDEQIEPLARIAHFASEHGCAPALQLAHAGRKASSNKGWESRTKLSAEQGAWTTYAPSSLAFSADFALPHALDAQGIQAVITQFAQAARRALSAGFAALEIHAAHGYLLHQFLSPLSNHRQDAYGGSFANRTRLVREVVAAIRQEWPERSPLFLRLSATDWAPGGWNIEESIQLCQEIKLMGVNLIDVSSGGLTPAEQIPIGPGYQTHFAARVRHEAAIPSAAVGLITSPAQAEHIIRTEQADIVLLGREILRDPYWPLRAAQALGCANFDNKSPLQYQRAMPSTENNAHQFINLSNTTEGQQKSARLLALTSPQSSQVTQPSTSPETAEHLAASHYSHYEALCAEGKEAEGIEWLLKLAKEKNVHWRVLTTLAQFAEKNGDDSLALDYYTQAKEKNPTSTPEDIPYAKLLIKLAKHERANTCLLSYRQSFPYDAEALALLKTCQQAQQQQQIRDYHRWQEQRLTGGLQADDYQNRAANLWTHQPLFEFFLILTPGHEAWLADSIDSLAEQYYDGWRLSIFAPSPSPDPEFLGAHATVRWMHIAEEAGLVEAINQRLNASKAEWVAFFPCGARFAPELLLNIADYSALHPEWLLIYSDEDQFNHDAVRSKPRFKPDFNLEFMRSMDYVGSFFVQRSALLKAGAYSNHQGAETYDTFLRIADLAGDDSTSFSQIIGHIPDVLYHLPEALAIADQAKSEKDEEAAASALREHLARRNINAQVQPGLIAGVTRRVFYSHAAKPLVSIIIPTKNRLDLLNACIESIIKLTRYSNWELILVDNASDIPEIKAYYALLQQTLLGRVSIIFFPGEFNYSAMNNLAAHQARGEYLLLLNNDTECIHDDWLDALLSHAQRPDVGVVGARLLYPKTLNLQHAGVVLGMGGEGTAHHVFINMPHAEPGYMNRAQLDQEYSAVTGACQLLRKALYLQVGGLSDKDMKVLLSDVDLCLKVAELGYRIIWTPFATLLHHGSASLKTTPQSPEFIAGANKDQQQFLKRWQAVLNNDHAWNRNLSLANLMPAVESELIAAWNPDFRDKPRVLMIPSASDGIREYRNLAPLKALHATGAVHYSAACTPKQNHADRGPLPAELGRVAPDTLAMNAPLDNARCAALLNCKIYHPNIFRVYLLDDLVDHLPEDSSAYQSFPAQLVRERLRQGLGAAQRLIVSTEPLLEAYSHLIDDIHVIPNTLNREDWAMLHSRRRQGQKLRVGWAGAQQHAGDLRVIIDVVKATYQEVDWVFFGMMPEEIKAYVAEFHPFEHGLAAYRRQLAALDLDLAVAPLQIHPFNKAKSNLRLLEYGILGWPVICTDIFPYQTNNPPVTRLANHTQTWITAIRGKVSAPDALAQEGDALRAWVVQHYLMEQHIDKWKRALLR